MHLTTLLLKLKIDEINNIINNKFQVKSSRTSVRLSVTLVWSCPVGCIEQFSSDINGDIIVIGTEKYLAPLRITVLGNSVFLKFAVC